MECKIVKLIEAENRKEASRAWVIRKMVQGCFSYGE
jgi:hypothetical protein